MFLQVRLLAQRKPPIWRTRPLPNLPVFTVPDGPSRLPYRSWGLRSPHCTSPHQAIPTFRCPLPATWPLRLVFGELKNH
jgi:hypothetical protein